MAALTLDSPVDPRTGSSDPFLTFSLEGSSLKSFKTKPKKKSLDPVWHEQFARSVTCRSSVPKLPDAIDATCLPRRPGKESMKLVCTCEDWDEVSGSDFMGQFSVDLDELKDQKVLKKWFKLEQDADGKRKGDVAGHVCLHVQWRHDPAIAFEPFSEDTSDKTSNELRIGMLSVSSRSLPRHRRAVDTHSSVSTQACSKLETSSSPTKTSYLRVAARTRASGSPSPVPRGRRRQRSSRRRWSRSGRRRSSCRCRMLI